MIILCGDIGGTKTLLRLSCFSNDDRGSVLHQRRYASKDFVDFNDVISNFIDSYGQIDIRSACFGVAGPVTKKGNAYSSQVTNLPWRIDSQGISDKFSIPNVVLLNDFESVGFGLEALTADDFVTLQSGTAVSYSPQLFVGAGTGFGMAYRFSFEGQRKILATEAGHCDFSPSNEQQLNLAQYLMHSLGRCSIESVLSGSGLVNIYRYICSQNLRAQLQQNNQHLQAPDPAASIALAAGTGNDEAAAKAMNLFVECYGGQTGNLALSGLTRGGVYIAGGIAPKIIDYLKTGRFMSAFVEKGRMTGLLQKMPVKVVINPEVGLLGSQTVAAWGLK